MKKFHVYIWFLHKLKWKNTFKTKMEFSRSVNIELLLPINLCYLPAINNKTLTDSAFNITLDIM